MKISDLIYRSAEIIKEYGDCELLSPSGETIESAVLIPKYNSHCTVDVFFNF
jgi:hypothetical protein